MTPADMFAMLQEIETQSKGVMWSLNDVSEIKKIDSSIISYTAKVGNWAVIIIRYTASRNPPEGSTEVVTEGGEPRLKGPSRRNWAYEGTAANAVTAVILRLTPELTEKLFNTALQSAN